MPKKIFLLLISFLIPISCLIGQVSNLENSTKLTISEGLAHNGVTSILEDSKGYLWFGTFDGLNRYDGYKLKTYKNTIDNIIMTNNRVRSLDEDFNGDLWIGTEAGITIFKYAYEKFIKIGADDFKNRTSNAPIIRQALSNKDLRLVLCVSERDGLFIFNEDYECLGQFYPKEISSDKKIIFFNGIQLDKTNYLCTTSVGLFLFNIETKIFRKILNEKINYCNSVSKISNDRLVITLLNGFTILDFHKAKGNYSFPQMEVFLENTQFKSSIVDDFGNIWLGTLDKGVIKIDYVDLLNNPIIKTETFNDGLKGLRTSTILKTSKNKCWLGTYNEGAYEFSIANNPFKSYSSKMNLDYGPSSNHTNHIVALDSNRAYLTTPSGGLTLFNTKLNNFEPIKKPLSKISEKITAIFIDSKKNKWLRLYGSNDILRIKYKSSNFEVINLNDNSELTENLKLIRSFTEDRFGNIWIGTNSNVYRISSIDNLLKVEALNKHSFFFNRELSQIRYVYSDPLYDFIWIGSDSDGLFRVKNQNNLPIKKLSVSQFIRDENDKSSLSSNFVTSIVRLPNKELWIGTEGGGVCKVLNSISKPIFKPITEKNGLSNNVVKNILYDTEGNMWISTNIGLNKIDIHNLNVRKFNEFDGLPFDDFWFEAKKMDNGIMMLSGLDGFCYFNPKEILKTERLPNFEIENFKIFNQEVKPGDTIGKRVILRKRVSDLEQINLNYNQNVFSLDIISLHFLNPENHKIRYRMQPLNEDWITVSSNKNTIDYNGLQPGDYELEVMASNSLNDWTKPKSIRFVISPPFWKTNVAYIIYFLLTGLVIYFIRKNALKMQGLKHNVEIEQLEINNVKELNEAKLRFFSNISHEIKTPLSLISGPTNNLLERFNKNPEIGGKLALIQRQSKKILQLIEQVQDFRRADANLLSMHYSRFNFNLFIEELAVDFNFFAKNDNKYLEIIGEESSIIVSADKDKLEKIFNNLLNNAFKYTETSDKIKIEYNSDGKDLIVAVSDTGRGIDEIDLVHIFERFYQSHKQKNVHLSGSGIGLAFTKRLVEMHYGFIFAESELNVGTKIIVKLPIVKQQEEGNMLINAHIKLPKEEEVSFKIDSSSKIIPNDVKVSGEFSESLIFYAEDNIEMRNYVTRLLSKFFKVKSFRNGQECLDALDLEWPDIVISDIQMPELSGLDLCVKIKSDLKTSHIPVVLLTALSNIEDHLKGIRDGADAYIKKPFDVKQLFATTESLLINRKQLRERYQVGIPLTKENKNNRNDNAFLDKLYSLIEENLDNQNFDLDSIAKEMYFNRTHFFQKVKMLTNQTPLEILRNYRLKKAAEYLIQKELSVNEVYIMVGFKSRTHFAKIFKEKYGMSASKYSRSKLRL